MLPRLPSLLRLALLWLHSAGPPGRSEPSVKCFFEMGPSREWLFPSTLTPGGLQSLRVNLVASPTTNSDAVLLNISWTLKQDGSIQMLKATKICVDGKGQHSSYSCVRCNYTEAFHSQTPPGGGKWEFHHIGFPVKPSTTYFIRAHNIPPANMNEDSTALSMKLESPGCQDPMMKYTKRCQDYGSLWTPNITACQKKKKVEVNFSTSSLGFNYLVMIQKNGILGLIHLFKLNQSQVSVVLPVTEEQGKGATVQIIPYFSTCNNNCIRHNESINSCQEIMGPEATNESQPWKHWLFFIFLALSVASWVLAVGLYLLWRHEWVKKLLWHAPPLLPPLRVLVLPHPQVCFPHVTCAFAEYLQEHCRSEVVLEQWQRRKLAEMGLVPWLTTQKKEADKIVFLFSGRGVSCDSSCTPRAGARDLFSLAFHWFCSDAQSPAALAKYLLVLLGEATLPEDHRALTICPTYRLTKEARTFRRDLLAAQEQGPPAPLRGGPAEELGSVKAQRTEADEEGRLSREAKGQPLKNLGC